MSNFGNGLSAEEMDRLCALPRIDKREIYGKAEKWLEQNRSLFENVRGEHCLLINVENLTFIIDETLDKAYMQYKSWKGPTPENGRAFLGITLPLPRI